MAEQTSSSELSDLFQILGLDVSRDWSLDEVKQEHDKQRAEWNKLSSMGVGKKAEDARQRREALRRLDSDAILASQTRFDEHVRVARSKRADQQSRDERLMRDEVSFAVAKGYLLQKEVADLRLRYQQKLTSERIEAYLHGHEVRSSQDAENLSSVVLEDIDSHLDALHFLSLYTFLGLPDDAKEVDLVHAANQKAEDARKHRAGELKYEHQKELAGHARSIFGNAEKRAEYNRHLQQRRFLHEVLAPYQPLCTLTKELTLQQVEFLLDRARSCKWSDEDAQQVLFSVALSAGWKVQVPQNSRTSTTAAEQQVVKELQRALLEARNRAQQATRELSEAEKRAAKAEVDAERAHQDRKNALRQLEETRRATEQRDRKIARLERQLERSKDSEAEVKKLEKQLEDIHSLQAEEVQRHISEYGPRLATHLASNELIAAQAIVKALPNVPPQWASDARRIEDGIREATRLLNEAKRPTTLENQREILASKALTLCADLDLARDYLRTLPPAPPTRLSAVTGDKGVMLSWSPSPSDTVRYVIVRKSDSPPASVHDGERMAVTSVCSWLDDTPPLAQPLWYAVYAEHGTVRSPSAALTAQAIVLKPDVRDLRFEVGDGRVSLTWRAPEGASAVVIVRREGTAPQSLNDGVRVRVVGSAQHVDRDVRNGREYYYRLYTEFLQSTGVASYSSGTVISCVPERPPTTVPDLGVHGSDGLLTHTVRLTAAPPEHGELRIYRSATPPSHVPDGRAPQADLDHLFGVDGRLITQMTDTLDGAQMVYYTPVLLVQGTAYLGTPKRHVYCPRVIDLRAADDGPALRVTWQWPTRCDEAELSWAARDRRAKGAGSARITRTSGTRDGRFEISNVSPGTYEVHVLACYHFGDQAAQSEPMQITVAHGGPVIVQAVLKPKARLLGGKQYEVELTAEHPIAFPALQVVAKEQSAPHDVHDGIVVGSCPAQRRPVRTCTISLTHFTPTERLHIAVFVAPGTPASTDMVIQPQIHMANVT